MAGELTLGKVNGIINMLETWMGDQNRKYIALAMLD